jgi:hypothetical protein
MQPGPRGGDHAIGDAQRNKLFIEEGHVDPHLLMSVPLHVERVQEATPAPQVLFSPWPLQETHSVNELLDDLRVVAINFVVEPADRPDAIADFLDTEIYKPFAKTDAKRKELLRYAGECAGGPTER